VGRLLNKPWAHGSVTWCGHVVWVRHVVSKCWWEAEFRINDQATLSTFGHATQHDAERVIIDALNTLATLAEHDR
jgi:hypothetical protein